MRARLRILALLVLAGTPAFAGDFEFAVVGDTRPRFESESFKPFQSLIVHINAANPAFIVNLGDLIYGYGPARKEKQWDKYEAIIKDIRAPYYQVPGNHDTHSKDARRVYGRRFGKFYQSFDYGDCHFVLLDNTEQERWGYIGPAQMDWLRRDLQQTRARSVFVFLHFPVWEPARITPEYYEFWAQTLHPLFKASRVRAVFGGHYHTYGPTREFDGIQYFITGGGGAELRPDYRKSGGEYHFMKVKVAGDQFDVRVATAHGDLSDPEADVMGGLQFAARHVSRIGIKTKTCDPNTNTVFTVSVSNPYANVLTGQAAWIMDASAFAIEPNKITLEIPPAATRHFTFSLKSLHEIATLESLPRLEFNAVSGTRRHRFHREIRFVQEMQAPFRAKAPALDGMLSDWQEVPPLSLGEGPKPMAELRTCHDGQVLYLAFCVPTFDAAEAKEKGFTDELQIGFALPSSDTDFGADLLRLGFNSDSSTPRNRTPGHETAARIVGCRSVSCATDGKTCYEIALPLKDLKVRPGGRLLLDLSFLVPDPDEAPTNPAVNTFSYRVRYGSDSLVPVYFVELNLASIKRDTER